MGWDQLIGMIQEARDIEAEERSRPPEDCPVCGTSLRDGGGGSLFCPFSDHFFWPDLA